MCFTYAMYGCKFLVLVDLLGLCWCYDEEHCHHKRSGQTREWWRLYTNHGCITCVLQDIRTIPMMSMHVLKFYIAR